MKHEKWEIWWANWKILSGYGIQSRWFIPLVNLILNLMGNTFYYFQMFGDSRWFLHIFQDFEIIRNWIFAEFLLVFVIIYAHNYEPSTHIPLVAIEIIYSWTCYTFPLENYLGWWYDLTFVKCCPSLKNYFNSRSKGRKQIKMKSITT